MSERLFTAVPLPPEVRSRVFRAAAALLEGSDAKAVEEANLHVTLRFLGDVEEERVAEIEHALGGAAAGVPAAEAELVGFGAFPDAARPRVVWSGVEDPPDTLVRLEEAVSGALAPLGFPREERPYTPHVTVGRVRVPRGRGRGRGTVRTGPGSAAGPLPGRLEEAAARPERLGAFPVAEVALVRSRLGPTGPAYETRARFPLRAPETG